MTSSSPWVSAVKTWLSCMLAVVVRTVCTRPLFASPADVRFHPEVPGAALLRGTHLGIALAGLVFRAAGRGEHRRIHHGASLDEQALGGEAGVDPGEDRLGQTVVLEQAAEVEHRGLVGHLFMERIQPEETLQREPVMDRVLQAGIAEVILIAT